MKITHISSNKASIFNFAVLIVLYPSSPEGVPSAAPLSCLRGSVEIRSEKALKWRSKAAGLMLPLGHDNEAKP